MRLIDADALISYTRDTYCKNCERRKGIKNGKMRFVYDIGDVPCRACDKGDMIDRIEEAPTVEPKRGRWIIRHNWQPISPTATKDFPFSECSECGFHRVIREKYAYCPNCGARMEGGKNDG